MSWGRRLAYGWIGLIVLGTTTLGIGDCHIGHAADGLVYDAVADVPQHAYAIVPGALVRDDGTPSVALVDRLEGARALFAAGRIAAIFVSGDTRSFDEDGVMQRWLVDHGVPAARIRRDGTGYRTRDTMENAKSVGITDAVICTQAFHLPRSLAWAQHVGIDAVGLIVDRHVVRGRLREIFARTLAMFEIWFD
jgi:SanA protein